MSQVSDCYDQEVLDAIVSTMTDRNDPAERMNVLRVLAHISHWQPAGARHT